MIQIKLLTVIILILQLLRCNNSQYNVEMMLVLETLWSMLMSYSIATLTISGCADNRTEIDETTNTSSVECSNIGMTGTVVWHLVNISSNKKVNIGECLPNGSCVIENKAFLISRSRSFVSHVTFIQPNRFLQDHAIVCSLKGTTPSRITACLIDVIYPANVSKCILNIARNQWQVTGSCEINKVYSSIGTYLCELYAYNTQSSNKSKVNTSLYAPIMHNNKQYRTGNCSFTAELPYAEGQYFYKAFVRPGNKEYIFENITILKPSVPRIDTCIPDTWVPKNSDMSCSCRADSLGQPQGRLLWLRNRTRLLVGEYGDRSLDFKTTLNGNENEEQFECIVEWIQNSSPAIHTARIPYISSFRFTANNVSNTLTINEHEPLTFECVAKGGPAPKIVIVRNDSSFTEPIFTSVDASGTPRNEVTHLNARLDSASCSHSSLYKCIASNGFDQPLSATIQIYVNCKPRRLTNDALTTDFSGQPINLTFTLLAYPMPNASAVYFMGHSLNANDTSKFVLDRNTLDMSCWPAGIYKSTCSIIVKNISNETAGYYMIMFTNEFGQENVTFQVIMMDSQQSDQIKFLLVAAAVLSIIIIIFVCITISMWRKRNTDEQVNSTTLTESPESINTMEGLPGEKTPIHKHKGATSRFREVYSVVKKHKIFHSYINVIIPTDPNSKSDTQSTGNAIELQHFQIGNTDKMDYTPQDSPSIMTKKEMKGTSENENTYFELYGSPPSEVYENDACWTLNSSLSSNTEQIRFVEDSIEGERAQYATDQILEKTTE